MIPQGAVSERLLDRAKQDGELKRAVERLNVYELQALIRGIAGCLQDLGYERSSA